MPQNPDPTMFNGNAIAAILGGISMILATFGIPKIFEYLKSLREHKYSEILKKLNETKNELKEVKTELYETRDQLKRVSTIVSVVLPMMKIKNQDDAETMELIRIFERESGISVTPAPTKNSDGC